MTDAGKPSRQVVEQRIRNRVIEYLELASSIEAQQEYQAAAPAFVDVPREVIEMWADNFPTDPRRRDFPFAYTPEEVQAIHEFHATWDEVADALLPDSGSLAQIQGRSEWEQLRRVAEATLAVFSQRGRLSEDTEVE